MDEPRALLRDRGSRLLAVLSLAGIVAGGLLALTGSEDAADVAWAATTAVMLVPLTVSVARALLRGDIGVDVIALMAMAGTLATGEYLAGAVVALMLSGGRALEDYASHRARRDLTALLERAPRVARRRSGERWEEVPVDTLVPNDLVLVRAGEIVPVDGIGGEEVLRLAASVDQLSAHVLAAGLVADAVARGLRLEPPTQVAEDPGQGIAGTVAGRRVLVGSAAFLARHGCIARRRWSSRRSATCLRWPARCCRRRSTSP